MADHRFKSFSLTVEWERGSKRRRKRHSGFIWLLSTGVSCHPWRPARAPNLPPKHHVHGAIIKQNNLLAHSLPPVWHSSHSQRRVCLGANTQSRVSVTQINSSEMIIYVSFQLFIHCKTYRLTAQNGKEKSFVALFSLILSSSYPVYVLCFLFVSLSARSTASFPVRAILSFIWSNSILKNNDRASRHIAEVPSCMWKITEGRWDERRQYVHQSSTLNIWHRLFQFLYIYTV